MNSEPIKILLVEDNPGDVALFKRLVGEASGIACELSHASRLDEAIELLRVQPADIVMLDLSLPDSQGLQTVERFRAAQPAFSIIVLTGLEDESAGLAAVKAGAQDYLIKGKIDSPLLLRAIRYAIERAKLLRELQEALANIKTLSGLLPICATCKKIRDDKGYWNQVEVYVMQHSDTTFSHGICPECAKKTMDDFLKRFSNSSPAV